MTDELDFQPLLQGNDTFALDLYNNLKESNKNLFFAPYSISITLAMTYAGARTETGQQMAEVLHFPPDQSYLHEAFAGLEAELEAVRRKGDIHLVTANALWPQQKYPFLTSYLALVEKYYGASIKPVDYSSDHEAARAAINAWVSAQTQHKINDLLKAGALGPLTRLVLVNAIHFKGDWSHQFEPRLTQPAPFWLNQDQSLETPMMTQTGNFWYREFDKHQILELPYIGDDLAMIILLPKARDGLAELEHSLSVANLEAWLAGMYETEVEVFLPKFTMKPAIDLTTHLKSMGMTAAFTMDKADFSGMDGQQHWLYLQTVLHQAFVEVNEEGTEATAATAAIAVARGLPPPPVVFRADHPFIFFIINSSGATLFLGRMLNPQADEA